MTIHEWLFKQYFLKSCIASPGVLLEKLPLTTHCPRGERQIKCEGVCQYCYGVVTRTNTNSLISSGVMAHGNIGVAWVLGARKRRLNILLKKKKKKQKKFYKIFNSFHHV